MVSLKIVYDTNLVEHHSSLQKDEILYINKAGAFKDEVLVACMLDESVTLILKNYLLVKNESITKNPIKVIASIVVMLIITGSTVSIYDFDCWDYKTEIIIKVMNTNPSVKIKVSEHEEHGKSTFDVEGNGCEVVSKKTKTEVNKEYINIRFQEYFRFNLIKTLFLSAIFITIFIIGIIAEKITTILFSAFLVALFVLLYFYSKKQLNRMKKCYLEM